MVERSHRAAGPEESELRLATDQYSVGIDPETQPRRGGVERDRSFDSWREGRRSVG